MFDTPFIVPVAAIIAWAFVASVRAKNGVGHPRWGRHDENIATPPMFNKMMEKAMADRDAEMQNLKERIIVLEKIITDTHKSHALSEEIEKLREGS